MGQGALNYQASLGTYLGMKVLYIFCIIKSEDVLVEENEVDQTLSTEKTFNSKYKYGHHMSRSQWQQSGQLPLALLGEWVA